MRLFGSSIVNEQGELIIGGCNVTSLKEKYNTPLYIMDEEHIRNQCKLFLKNFSSPHIETEVVYASKAFLTIAMCKLIEQEGLSLDVVSGGELYTAIKAGFPNSRIILHGNNKTKEELELALNYGVGRIIIDNSDEIDLIEDTCRLLSKTVDVLLRVNPGIEAHTHEYIKTTENNSKFGESIYSNKTLYMIEKICKSKNLRFQGLHSHIGSQIFDEKSFFEQISTMLLYNETIYKKTGIEINELNLGGGFGVYYTSADDEMNIDMVLKKLLGKVKDDCERLDLKVPKILIEPGRAIVANAGTTLYEVGSIKHTFGGKRYVFVDGSMNDNIRTALYEADYEAAIGNRMNDQEEAPYTVTGKCCESGDILVKNVLLPEPRKGDLLTVFSTGAYNYSMASNYNRLTRPAVIFVKNGKSRLVVRRETYEDVIKNDIG